MAEGKTGRCLCGAVSFTVKDDVTDLGVCHCNMCQRWSGGIHVGFNVSADGVAFEGEDNLTIFTSSEWAERAFCRTCGSPVFYRITMDGPMKGSYVMEAGSLDDKSGLSLTDEIYVDHKPDCYTLAGDHRRMTEAEFLKSIGMGAPDA